MKVKAKHKVTRKRALIATGFIVAAILFSIWYTHHFQIWPFHTKVNTVEKNGSDLTNSQTKAKAGETNKNVDTTKNTSEIPISTTTSVQITQLVQDDQKVTYSAKITDPSSSGTCSAVFTNPAAQPVTSVTTTSSDTCGPVSIPNAQFVTLGIWKLTLRYYADNLQAVATQEINIK